MSQRLSTGNDRPPTPDELAAMRAVVREGQDRLHAAANPLGKSGKPLTDAESAARARARLDKQGKP